MATYNLGQVAIVNKGAWSSATNYAVLNTVTHNGGSFMAIAANSNVEPGVSSGWATSWVAMARGIKTIDIVGDTTSTAHAVITLSDGTTVTGSTFNTNGVAAGSITDTQITSSGISRIANNAVTDAMIMKTGENAVMPKSVGIKYGTGAATKVDTPDSSATGIAPGQIYLKYV